MAYKIEKKIFTEVIVTGYYPTALSTLRCLRKLKKENVRIWSIGKKVLEDPAFYSYIPDKKIILFEEEGIVDCLLRIRNQFSSKPIILLTSDNDAEEISNRREELEKFYTFLLPSKELVDILLDKTKFAKIAAEKSFDVPKSLSISDENQLKNIKSKIKFPFIVKPYLMHSIRVNDEKDLEKVIDELMPINYKFIIVQEWIEGDDDQIYFCLLLFDKNSNIVASFVAKKLRQHPISYGTTSLCISTKNDELLTKSIEIFKQLNYKGYCSIEYKFDKKSNKYYIMEPTVGRFDLQVAITMASGVNFPEKLFRILNNQTVDNNEQINNILWINEITDFLSYLSDKTKKYGYLRNYLKKHIKVFFDWQDPLPFFCRIIFVVISRIKFVQKK